MADKVTTELLMRISNYEDRIVQLKSQNNFLTTS